jgi:hypothetical protein
MSRPKLYANQQQHMDIKQPKTSHWLCSFCELIQAGSMVLDVIELGGAPFIHSMANSARSQVPQIDCVPFDVKMPTRLIIKITPEQHKFSMSACHFQICLRGVDVPKAWHMFAFPSQRIVPSSTTTTSNKVLLGCAWLATPR